MSENKAHVLLTFESLAYCSYIKSFTAVGQYLSEEQYEVMDSPLSVHLDNSCYFGRWVGILMKQTHE